MSQILDIMPGWKTYLTAAGLAGLAVYQASVGEYEQAVTSLVAAVGLIFARRGATRERETLELQIWAKGGLPIDSRD